MPFFNTGQNTGLRMVEGMFEKITAIVVVGEVASDEFDVNIGLRQGSVLSPLLFVAVLDQSAGRR